MNSVSEIGIDIETKSGEDLTRVGVYKYVEDPDWEIQLFSYSVNGGDVRQVDLTRGETIPREILSALTDKSVRKWGQNVSFERVNLSRFIGLPSGEYIDPEGWFCTMVACAYNGLPQSLEDAGKALKIEAAKMKEGKALIKLFAMPKGGAGKRWTKPADAPEKWETYKSYNIRDVEAEEEIRKRLDSYMPPQSVWEEYWDNERINDRGIRVDRKLIKSAIRIDEKCFESLMEEMKTITGLSNPNSPSQLKEWLCSHGVEVSTLGKDTVKELLEKDGIPSEVRRLLKLRLMAAKSSVKKYQAMDGAVCADGRIRGMFRFYGAGRTGRFSGKIVQFQNLYRNSMPDLDEARELVRSGDFKALSLLYEDVPDVLSQLIRTALIPEEGHLFAVADYSAIEARVLAWLAGEDWVLEAFANGEDIYCTTASRMYHVPVEKHGQNSDLRAKGKQAVLACIAEGSLVLTDQGLVPIEQVTNRMKLWDGKAWVTHDGVIYKGEREVIIYDGLTATPDHLVYVEGQSEPVYFGVAAASGAHLIQTGDAKAVGGEPFRIREAQELDKRTARVYDIRNAGRHHRFTVSEKLVHNCGYGGSVGAISAMDKTHSIPDEEKQSIVEMYRSANPHIVKFWQDIEKAAMKAIREHTTTKVRGIRISVTNGMLFMFLPSGRRLAYPSPRIGKNRFGSDSITFLSGKTWMRVETFGGSLVENLTQAVARDLLTSSLHLLSGYKVVGHIHDEVIVEVPENAAEKALEEIEDLMVTNPLWSKGIPLKADGYVCTTYRKE